jgi:DNA-binding transcriptional regulator YiaG
MSNVARDQFETGLEQDRRSFAQSLRLLRYRLAEKQAALSSEVGCSDAAVSLWESGCRLPTLRNFHRLLTVVASSGATNAELLELRAAWQRDRMMRARHPSFLFDEATSAPRPEDAPTRAPDVTDV